jgi:hypothetical protein
MADTGRQLGSERNGPSTMTVACLHSTAAQGSPDQRHPAFEDHEYQRDAQLFPRWRRADSRHYAPEPSSRLTGVNG